MHEFLVRCGGGYVCSYGNFKCLGHVIDRFRISGSDVSFVRSTSDESSVGGQRLGIVHYNTFYLLSKMTEQSFEIVQVCVVERDVVVIGEIVKPEHGGVIVK